MNSLTLICRIGPVNVNAGLTDPAKAVLGLRSKQASCISSGHFFIVLCDLSPERFRSRCVTELLLLFNHLSGKLISFATGFLP